MKLTFDDKTYRTTPTACPACGYKLDAATGIAGENNPPSPGCLSVCMECGEWLVYDDQMQLEKMSPEVIAQLDSKMLQTLGKARKAVLFRFSRRKG